MEEVQAIDLFKVSVSVGGQTHTLFEGLEYEGKFWFVPHWYDSPDKTMSKPSRLVRFDNLPHEDLRKGPLALFFLQMPMPTVFFDPKPLTRKLSGIEHLEAPDMFVEGSMIETHH